MPAINKDNLRRYTYDDYRFRSLLDVMLDNYQISPSTHPTVVDLAAGDGSIGALFAERGWRENNMTCIDKYVSTTPIVTDASWYYLDLLDLALKIDNQERLPEDIVAMKGSFDIVGLMQVSFREYEERTLWNFFAKGKDTLIISKYKLSKLGSNTF